MNDHLRPVGKPALGEDVLGAVPLAALQRALKTPVLATVDVGEDAVLVLQHD
jgi:hypothetical protein